MTTTTDASITTTDDPVAGAALRPTGDIQRRLTPARSTLCVGALAALVKLGCALPFLSRYGWDRDELYFLQASRHLSLGYVDFPFLTALVGHLTVDLTGPSLVALRITGVVAGMLAAVLMAACARELGGGLRAQLFASLALVLTPYGLGIGMIFHPTMFDLLTWVAFAYLALRILLRPEPRLWPWLGLVAGVGLETKGTILALLITFGLGLLVFGPRHHLRQRGPWLAGAIALACLMPYLGWELAHGWPTLRFLPTQDAATAASTSRWSYLVEQLAFLGAAVPLIVIGIRELWRDPRLRALAVIAPATSLLFFAEQGRSYYALPAIALPLTAGVIVADRWLSGGRRRPSRWARVGVPVLVAHLALAAVAAPLVWPVLPTATMVELGLWKPTFYKDEIGWPTLADETARVWSAIPIQRRADTGLLAQNYGEAGALALYGPADGLPMVISGHLSFQYWHPAVMSERHLITVGFGSSALHRLCLRFRIRGRISNDWHIANEEAGGSIATCTLSRSLGRIWSTEIASDRL